MIDMKYEKLLEEISQLSTHIVRVCTEKKLHIATAESCTGGMISAAITAVSGSSSVIELGICSYSNRIKHEILGVSSDTLDKYSEYSVQCAEEMALGAMKLSGAELSVSTTGVAGPTGGSEQHPVGEVCIAVRYENAVHSKRYIFTHDDKDAPLRDYIRACAVRKALMLLDLMIMANAR